MCQIRTLQHDTTGTQDAWGCGYAPTYFCNLNLTSCPGGTIGILVTIEILGTIVICVPAVVLVSPILSLSIESQREQ